MNKMYRLGYDSAMIGIDFINVKEKYKKNCYFLNGYLDYIKERKEENKKAVQNKTYLKKTL